MRTDTLSRRQDIYRDAVAVIRQDYAADLTVETVARAVATSRRQLQRVFDEVGGVSFRLVLTRVHMSPEGKATFPDIDPEMWRVIERREQPPGPGDDCGFTYLTYIRAGAA